MNATHDEILAAEPQPSAVRTLHEFNLPTAPVVDVDGVACSVSEVKVISREAPGEKPVRWVKGWCVPARGNGTAHASAIPTWRPLPDSLAAPLLKIGGTS